MALSALEWEMGDAIAEGERASCLAGALVQG